MKKAIILISPILLSALIFSSCKKNYDCECINIKGETKNYVVNATNKTEAQKNCDKHDLLGHCELVEEE